MKVIEDFQELAVNQLEVRLSKTKRACNADLAAVFRPVTPFGVKEKVPKHLLDFFGSFLSQNKNEQKEKEKV